MLAQHLQGVVGFSKPTQHYCLRSAQRWALVTEARSAHGPEIGRLSRESGKVQKGRTPASRHDLERWLRPLVQKGHLGIRVRRFVECIAEEILLFPVARTGPHERIRVPIVVDYSRSLSEQ